MEALNGEASIFPRIFVIRGFDVLISRGDGQFCQSEGMRGIVRVKLHLNS